MRVWGLISQKKFLALWASVWSKMGRGGGGGGAGPLPESATLLDSDMLLECWKGCIFALASLNRVSNKEEVELCSIFFKAPFLISDISS